MFTTLIEATNTNEFNHGKFVVARFDEGDRRRRSVIVDECDAIFAKIESYTLLRQCDRTGDETIVIDLQTGEGVILPSRDRWPKDERGREWFVHEFLNRHAVWVCPLFEPFLVWLLGQDVTDLSKLPPVVRTLPAIVSAVHGYRRPATDNERELEAVVARVLGESPEGMHLRHMIEHRLGRKLVGATASASPSPTEER